MQVCEGLARDAAIDAETRIAAAASGSGALVEELRVRVGLVGAGTVLAQANAEVDGRRVRVQEAGAELAEVLDRLAAGLRGRIAAVSSGWSPRPWPRRVRARGGPAAVPAQAGPPRAQQWWAPAATAPTAHPCTELPCPSGPQTIGRRKSVHLVWCSPDAAARTMDAMDYDIHLFTDPATETDAVVYRVGPTGYRLARTAAAGPPTRPAVPLTLNPCGAPELTDQQAVGRLLAADLPFLFFAQPATRRGRVLYRRFDGRLGLITAAP
ncbi:sigma 54 modulation/S30EA ribosomal C-terminal domain-containing protein [Kitasatospora sp. NPDC058170]|uniref:sigma 54 modulation/S30EA ribosomal C-terminal domain-containing protein n=1 Tax=Kitasatospora sp. NPDC058170 TaxID=3346364 RepID=UPI0036DAA97A